MTFGKRSCDGRGSGLVRLTRWSLWSQSLRPMGAGWSLLLDAVDLAAHLAVVGVGLGVQVEVEDAFAGQVL